MGIVRWGTRTTSGELWGPAAQVELERGGCKPPGNCACIYLAITICYTSVDVSEASEPQYSKAPCPCHQLFSGAEPLLELLASALH